MRATQGPTVRLILYLSITSKWIFSNNKLKKTGLHNGATVHVDTELESVESVNTTKVEALLRSSRDEAKGAKSTIKTRWRTNSSK